MRLYLDTIGNSVIRSIRSYFRMISFFGLLLLALSQVRRCAKRFNRYEFMIHNYQYGPKILPKITLFAVVVSTFVTLFTIRQLTVYQSISYLGTVLSSVIIREAGPLLIAFFVIIYASVYIFDELEEIKLHLGTEKAHDYDSYEFIYEEILPRFFAILLCMPLLFFYFSIIAFFTVCFWVSVGDAISLNGFLSQLETARTNNDLILGLTKIIIFAAVNAFFACFYGMQHEPDPHHKSLPLIKSIYVNLGYLVITDIFIEAIAIQVNY